MSKGPNSSGTQRNESISVRLDPDPITIALVALAVYSALISTLDLVLRHLDSIADEYRRPLTQALLGLRGDLKRLQAQLKTFEHFLKSNEISPESPLTPSAAKLNLTPEDYETYRRLVQDTIDIVRDVENNGMVLATLVETHGEKVFSAKSEDVQRLQRDLGRAIDSFSEARYAKNLSTFLQQSKSASRALNRAFNRMQKVLWKTRD